MWTASIGITEKPNIIISAHSAYTVIKDVTANNSLLQLTTIQSGP